MGFRRAGIGRCGSPPAAATDGASAKNPLPGKKYTWTSRPNARPGTHLHARVGGNWAWSRTRPAARADPPARIGRDSGPRAPVPEAQPGRPGAEREIPDPFRGDRPLGGDRVPARSQGQERLPGPGQREERGADRALPDPREAAGHQVRAAHAAEPRRVAHPGRAAEGERDGNPLRRAV